MPEGPEILCITTYLKDKILGGTIKLSQDINNNLSDKNKIVDISCKGKLLFLKINDDNKNYYLHIHLGLSGWIVFSRAKYVKYSFIVKKK